MYSIIRKFLFLFPPETIHDILFSFLKVACKLPGFLTFISFFWGARAPQEPKELCGLRFCNSIGLAAGFDKNGELIEFWEALGFGHMEVGSVTSLPSQGNPKPRIFRLREQESILNRCGLNNDGAKQVALNLQKARKKKMIIGVNIAKTHSPEIIGRAGVRDMLDSYVLLAPLADYVTLNISCPNTREGKTFEDPVLLEELLREVHALRYNTPLFLKLSPILTERGLEDVINISLRWGINGFVVSNTLPYEHETFGRGGLSGLLLQESSSHLLQKLKDLLPSECLVVASGGVLTAENFVERLHLGANLVQIYSALIYRGPSILKEMLLLSKN